MKSPANQTMLGVENYLEVSGANISGTNKLAADVSKHTLHILIMK